MMFVRAILGLTLAGMLPGLAVAECGAVEAPCAVDEGAYYVALPEAKEGAPAVLWLHGYARSGRNVVKRESFVKSFTDRGYVLIAPSGQPDAVAPKNLDWGVEDGLDLERDDIAFLRAVLADAIGRFDIDQTRVLAAGFSRGGSMVWDLACRAPDSAVAFAAVAGGFWEPMWKDCDAPVDLNHTHGFSDRLVPLEGRAMSFHGHDFVQGNVFKGIEIWRRVNGCTDSASEHETDGAAWVKRWTNCDLGSITLRIWPGGHGIPKGWTAEILDWFEAIIAARDQTK